MKKNLEKTMKEIRDLKPEYQASIEKLGVVLEELVGKLEVGGFGIDVAFAKYVAEARGMLRYLVELIDDCKEDENP